MREKLLINLDNPIIRDHTVSDQHVFPGLAYIDLIFQVFRDHGLDSRALELRNLVIFQKLIISKQEQLHLEIECTESQVGQWNIEISGLLHELDGLPIGGSKRYAAAKMESVDNLRFEETIDIGAIAASTQRIFNVDELYEGYRRLGLIHGIFMRPEGHVRVTEEAVYVECWLNEIAKSTAGMMMFHPSLIDGSAVCGGGAISSLTLGSHSLLALPLSLRSFRASELIQKRCTARIQRDSVTHVNELTYCTLDFFDDQGRKVAELKELASKSITDPSILSPKSDASSSVRPDRSQEYSQSIRNGDTTVELFIRRLLADKLHLPVERIDPTAGYYELGIDSAGLLELAQEIETFIGAKLSPTLLFEYVTTLQLSAHLSEHYPDAFTACLKGNRPEQMEKSFVNDAPELQYEEKQEPQSYVSSAEQTVSTPFKHEPIAIIGMAGRFPQARNVEEFWENLKSGKDCITEIPPSRWDWRSFEGLESPSGKNLSRWGGFVEGADCFDPRFFRISPREADLLDPQERLFLENCWETIEDAGYTPATLSQAQKVTSGQGIGVFVGVMHKDYALLANEAEFRGRPNLVSQTNASIANRVSFCCNLHGPSMVVDTVCSSSLVAVHLAIQSLLMGECSAALAGGVNLSLHPSKYLAYGMMDMHASDGRCRAFGGGGDGYVSGEAVCSVLLKPLSKAVEDGDHIYAVIRSSGTNHVGAVSGFTVPSPVAQADLIASCLDKADIQSRSVSYVEAHGTGTSLGDPIEIEGLTRAFSRQTQDRQFCAIGSVKSNIGHTESAAGLCGLIKVALQLHYRLLVPSLHAQELNPRIDWPQSPFFVQQKLENWRQPNGTTSGSHPRRAALSSFGATGTNAHLILEEYIHPKTLQRPPATSHQKLCLIPLSARSEKQLHEYAKRLLVRLEGKSISDAEVPANERALEANVVTLENIAHTLQLGRKAMSERLAFVVDNIDALIESLAAFVQGKTDIETCSHKTITNRKNVSLGADADVQASMDEWIQSGRLKELGDAWVRGVDIDWNDLYSDRRPMRISLPTYPFLRERHWLDRDLPTSESFRMAPQAISLASPKHTTDSIAIIGMSGCFPGARDLYSFWENLVEGKDCITEIPPTRWNWREIYGDPHTGTNKTKVKWGGFIDEIAEFDPLFFGISPKEATLMDPQQRLLMTHTWKAIEDAGYSSQSLSGTKTGIFVGTAVTGYSELIVRADIAIEGYSTTGAVPSVGPNRMSYLLNLHGPSEPIETACSSSIVAIHRAIRAIQCNDCETALVGGINTIVTPSAHISFSKAGMLCEDGRCKTFSKDADGCVRGEGVGILFLKKLSDAERDGDHIYALIRGSSENHGGKANSLTAPNPEAQAELLKLAYREADIDPRTITYIETHGTGTPLGDPIEVEGLKRAFEQLSAEFAPGESTPVESSCGLGSVKTNIGHLELAAGIAGVIKVVLQLKNRMLVRSLHSGEISPALHLEDGPFYVVKENQPWQPQQNGTGQPLPRRAGVSSFGFGGVNAHAILEEYIAPAASESKKTEFTYDRPALIILSAKREARLREQAKQMSAYLSSNDAETASLADLAYTLQVGRDPMEYRIAFTADSLHEVKRKLDGYLRLDPATEVSAGLHRGKVSKDKNAPKTSQEDQSSRHTVSRLIENGRFDQLLAFWVNGLSFDWSELYGESSAYIKVRPKRVSLPTYSFDRGTYWVVAAHRKSGIEGDAETVRSQTDSIRNTVVEVSKGDEMNLQTVALRSISSGDWKVSDSPTEFDQQAKTSLESISDKQPGLNSPLIKLEEVARQEYIPLKDLGFSADPAVPAKVGYPERKRSTDDPTEPIRSGVRAARPEESAMDGIQDGLFKSPKVDVSVSWIQDILRQTLSPLLGIDADDIAVEDVFADLGLDSIIGVQWIRVINKRFGLDIEAVRVYDYPNISDLSAYLSVEMGILKNAQTSTLDLLLQRTGDREALLAASSAHSVASEPASPDQGWIASARVEEILKRTLSPVLGIDAGEIALHDAFVDLGLDSIMGVQWVRIINERFGIDIDAVRVYDYPNIADLAGYVSRQLSLAQLPSSATALPAKEVDADPNFHHTESFRHVFEASAQMSLPGTPAIPVLSITSERSSPNRPQSSPVRVQEILKQTLSSVLGIGAVDIAVDDAFLDLGLDSIIGVQWVRIINKRFDIDIEAVRVYDYPTIADLAEYLATIMSHPLQNRQEVPPELAELSGVMSSKPPVVSVEFAVPTSLASEPVSSHWQEAVSLQEIEPGIVQVTMQDRIHKNTFSNELTSGLFEAFELIRQNDTYKVVMLTGYDSFFCCGGTKEGLLDIQAGRLKFTDSNVFSLPLDCKLPVIAAMQGHAIGAGWALGMFSDFIIFSQQGIYESNYMKYGFTPGAGATLIFPEKFAPGLANEILFTARQFTGIELEKRGIPYPVLHRDAILPYATDLARTLCQSPRGSLIELKAHTAGPIRAKLQHTFQREIAMHENTFVGNAEVLKRVDTMYGQTPGARGPEAPSQRIDREEEKTESYVSVPSPNVVPDDQRIFQDSSASSAIAIIGMSGAFPKSRTLDEFWNNLAEGRDCISEIPVNRWSIDQFYDSDPRVPGKTYGRWMGSMPDVDRFDWQFFNISLPEAQSIDPQQRLFLEHCWSCIEESGINPRSLSGSRCGVYVGCGWSDYVAYTGLSAEGMMGNATSILAARISYFLNLKGPCLAIDTACSSALVAIAEACDSLLLNRCDAALAGGVTVLTGPGMHIMTSKAGMLSRKGKCFTFDERADGFVPGEGVGVILLKRLSDALRDQDNIHGVIRGWAVNQDGKTNGITAPSVTSQVLLEKQTYQSFGINPETISLVEAHGTGTRLGDPIEVEALKESFTSFTEKRNYCALGSVKSNIGHLLAAAGIAGVIKVLLSLRHQMLPPTINFEALNEHISIEESPFYINTALRPWTVTEGQNRRAAVNSFGFSGTNAHIVIEEHRSNSSVQSNRSSQIPVLIVLSARNKERLREQVAQLSDHIGSASYDDSSLASIAYTLQIGREAMEHRLGFLVRTITQLREKMVDYMAGKADIGEIDDCYQGEIKKFKEVFSIFNSDTALREGIAGWIRQGQFAVLLDLWVKGLSFDWMQLYGHDSAFKSNKPGRISLPTYPFLRERCWSEINEIGIEGHTSAVQHGMTTHASYTGIHDSEKAKEIVLEDEIPRFEISATSKEADDYSRIVSLTSLSMESAVAEETGDFSEELMSVEELRSELVEGLAKALYLESADVDADVVFSEQGLDSVTGVGWVHEINQRYETSLSASQLYDYPNITALSNYLIRHASFRKRGLQAVPEGGTLPLIREDVVEISVRPVFQGGREKEADDAVAWSRDFKALDVSRGFARMEEGEAESGVAIVGMSGAFPKSKDLMEFWENLATGRDCVSEIPAERWSIGEYYDPNPEAPGKTYCKWMGVLEEMDRFDPLFFNISPAEAMSMDPQQRLFLEHSWSCIEEAGINPLRLSGSRCGVYVGCGPGDYGYTPGGNGLTAQVLTGNSSSILSARISYFLNLKGPCLAIDTSCSSSLVAIAEACNSLVEGRSDMALAGGVCVMTGPSLHIMTSKARMLSKEGRCFTFDERADGFVPGEGVGVLLLKRLKDAVRDRDHVHGVLRGWGVNHDGKTNGMTAPSAQSQALLEKEVYSRFRINPETISLVEAHGTGTRLGDPIEVEALTASFRAYTDRQRYCALGSVKSNIGHLLAAAGVSGVIKVLLALRHRQLPPTIHYESLNEHVVLDESPFYINHTLRPWEVKDGHARQAAVSSFGFSGTNAHVVIEEYSSGVRKEPPANAVTPEQPAVIVLSAKSEERLREQAERLLHYMQSQQNTKVDLARIAYTLQAGREPMEYRLALIARTPDQVIGALKDFTSDRRNGDLLTGQARRNKEGVWKFESDDDVSTLIDAWIGKRKLKKLADAWTHGLDVDWDRLYPAGTPEIISLPTYPFLKNRYWISNDITKSGELDIESCRKEQVDVGGGAFDSYHGERPAKISLQALSPEPEHFRDYGMTSKERDTLPPKDSVLPHLQGAVSHEVRQNPSAPVTDTTWASKRSSQDISQLEKELRQMLSDTLYLDLRVIEGTKLFSELGLDSIIGLEWVNAINHRYQTDIAASILYQYATVERLAAFLADQIQNADRQVERIGNYTGAFEAELTADEEVVKVPRTDGSINEHEEQIDTKIEDLDSLQTLEYELSQSIAALLLDGANTVNKNAPFSKLGMDEALGAAWLRAINRKYEIVLETNSLVDYPSICRLARCIYTKQIDKELDAAGAVRVRESFTEPGFCDNGSKVPQLSLPANDISDDQNRSSGRRGFNNLETQKSTSGESHTQEREPSKSKTRAKLDYDTREVHCIRKVKNPVTRLLLFFCFGHGERSYQWLEQLPANIEVWGVGTTEHASWEQMISALAEDVCNLFDKPVLAWGHCMGAIIAFDVLYYLEQRYSLKAKRAIFSSSYTPDVFEHLKNSEPFCDFDSTMSDEALDQLFVDHNLIPPRAWGLPIVAPSTLRNDVALIKSYSRDHDRIVGSDLSIIRAKGDSLVSEPSLFAGWRQLTTKECHYEEIEGTHLFFHSPSEKFLTILEELCAPEVTS